MNQASELARHLLDRCGCGHYYGDHAAWPPHRCVTFEDPDCPCELFQEPLDADPVGGEGRAGTVRAPGPDNHPGPAVFGEVGGGAGLCDYCAGRGVIEYEDPIIGGLVLASCPDCEGQP